MASEDYINPIEVVRKMVEAVRSPNPTLLPYSGPNVRCLKCGDNLASIEYRSNSFCVHNSADDTISSDNGINERLHRRCVNCGYMWDEACTNGGEEYNVSDHSEGS